LDYEEVTSSSRLHDQTIQIGDDASFYEVAGSSTNGRLDSVAFNSVIHEVDESSTLLSSDYRENYCSDDIEAQQPKSLIKSYFNGKYFSGHSSDEKLVNKVIRYTPSVILGLLLNILNGLSYGMIIFPISEKIFSNLGSAGLSIFYISCIVSQLVYSAGGSAFKAGVGCQMVEVIPFFHTLAANITSLIGEDRPEEIIATTITTYAVSSVFTGVVFYVLGKLKLGQIIGFFPRHILIGCIGGVGYFLTQTAIEVSSRLGTLEYHWNYLSSLLEWSNSLKIIIPLFLTLLLLILQHHNHNALVLPSYFILVFLLTHLLIQVVPHWSLPLARNAGYVFSAEGSDEPWYDFYKLYNFKLVNWTVILKQTPSMLALTFFGLLHVPINVPALAISTKQDNVDLDRELIAHGYSNFLSGIIGSVQNYLVYTNTILFVRAGADSRLAGFMLAIATIGILFVGPVVIGFIPVCVVGSLIFLLGFELLKEALYDTIGRVNRVEYITIVIIVLTMGVYDFVFGIVVGIIIASFHFLYENTKIPIITNEYSGELARSTVIRHPLQRQFLTKIGNQIHVLKLQGFLFFGSIGKVEASIKTLFESEKYDENPIRYLILDFKNVLNVDFSAAEGFIRIKKFILDHNAFLVISLGDKPTILKSLRKVGIFEPTSDSTELGEIQIFHDLNASLEWCENEFLIKYKQLQSNFKNTKISASSQHSPTLEARSFSVSTVRNTNFIKQAQIIYNKETSLENSTLQNLDQGKPQVQPLSLLLFALQGISCKGEDHWSSSIKYFKKLHISQDESISFDPSDSYFILIESGIIVITYKINEAANIYETYLPKTILGRFASDDSSKERFGSEIKAKRDTTVWILKDNDLQDLRKDNAGVYEELLLVVMSLNDERFENITGYSLIST
jgi:SulP family sulfate permease